ncbi:MAG: hypothetical protein JWM88_3132 [Verrucomicrobia bacterium]|nr:hypothetical protein [Verrucomicrobiota bacterium]
MKNSFGLILLLGGAAIILCGLASATNTVALVLLGIVTTFLGISGLLVPRKKRRGHIRPLRRTLSSSRRSSPSTSISP